jgi:hypothetical protein
MGRASPTLRHDFITIFAFLITRFFLGFLVVILYLIFLSLTY